MPGQHALLSPSASERWLSCPASVRLSQLVPKGPESSYAAEGTTAHALGEIEASRAFGLITKRQYDVRFEKWLKGAELADYDILEMRRHIADYVTLLEDRMSDEMNHGAFLLLEQRMATGIEGCWGTGDAVIVTPTTIEVVDLKYGAGVPVSAVGNSQLRLYGCGALDTFGILGGIESVTTTIFQPRLESISSETLSVEELIQWREDIRPTAAEALAGSDRFGPSEKACRWCQVSGNCRARVEKATAFDFGDDPDLLSNQELSELYGELPQIRDWCNALEDLVLDKLYSQGQEIAGYKVVRSNGRRSITDTASAIERLVSAGFSRDDVVRMKMATLGELEKLVGAKQLPEVLGDALTKSEGKPAVAPIDDPRSPIDPAAAAAEAFKEEEEP